MKSAKRSTPKKTPRANEGGAALTADLPTTTALKLFVVLQRAAWAAGEVAKADIERHDLTPAEFGILEALHHKGPLLLGDLQKRILVSSGGITFLVDRLVKRGLAERQACPNDRRARYAALTKQGTQLMRSIFPVHAAAIREAMGGLSAAEQREATRLLKALGVEAQRLAEGTPACRKAMAEAEPA
jgi:MarR family 2-MHQ and catechol resistance regulon transcriptional repressor